MTMKFTQLITYWDADEAYSVIAFLDELRDMLWATYGDHITENAKNSWKTRAINEEQQLDLDLGDVIPF